MQRVELLIHSLLFTYVPINDTVFSAGEIVTGLESNETATLETFTAGDRLVTTNFTVDTGQRDNFYDIGRLVRKANSPAPVGKLLIVFDYFTHGTGDFFTVDSYSSIPYKDIPTYSATRVDPEVAEPTGEYDLRDAVDFRPRVKDATISSTGITVGSGATAQTYTASKVTSYSFNFESRTFTGTGASTINIPKDGSSFGYDFEHYLSRRDALYLSANGEFIISSGAASEIPEAPKSIDDAMLIANISLPPFVVDRTDVSFDKEDNRRYTMRDIGRLESRIENVEYYTALNLLEKDAQSLQIQDANGLDRFKSGFVVDNFSGHATGDVKHPDYRAAVDMQNGELRPKHFMKNVVMIEENGTEAQRANSQYQKTGSILTLPYESQGCCRINHMQLVVENLNPVLIISHGRVFVKLITFW